ncbi:MAG: ATP-binding protein [Candidatus Sumerlaeota bacterium]|nr:ATP-binding protein [Candidatus Sumerlaeota bacterium]
MLSQLTVKGLKSLNNVTIDLPPMTVLFGPNAAGKSNLLDAIQALSQIANSRTLADALTDPIRGYAIESFAFPAGGLAELLSQREAHFQLDATLDLEKNDRFRYRIGIEIQPGSGSLSVWDEYLAALSQKKEIKKISIEVKDGQISIRLQSHPSRPRIESLGKNYAVLSDLRFAGNEFRNIERCRKELQGWRVYYLDPRVSMRSACPPSDARDIGMRGENIAPFLFQLIAEKPKCFDAIKRTLRTLIPSVEDLTVDLDKRRGTLDIQIRQAGKDFSSRIISEGTLRVMALCAIAANPWSGSLIAFEEPENGVHPRRLELIAELLSSIALHQSRQVVVTTHSPLFCDAMLKKAQSNPEKIALYNVRRGAAGTEVKSFESFGALFQEHEISQALTSGSEDGLFEKLMMRGLLDE